MKKSLFKGFFDFINYDRRTRENVDVILDGATLAVRRKGP